MIRARLDFGIGLDPDGLFGRQIEVPRLSAAKRRVTLRARAECPIYRV
jgi:hypothetical protein